MSIAVWLAAAVLLMLYMAMEGRIVASLAAVLIAGLIFCLAAVFDLYHWVFCGSVLMLAAAAGVYAVSRLWVPMAVAVLGLLAMPLADWNSTRVSDLRMLPTATERAAEDVEAAGRQATLARAREGAESAISTSNTRGSDASDEATPPAAAEGDAEVPLYKREGRVEREEGEQLEGGTGELAREVTGVEGVEVERARMLPAGDVKRANRWDTWNLWLVRLLLPVLGVGLWMEYLQRFEQDAGPGDAAADCWGVGGCGLAQASAGVCPCGR